PHNAHPFSGWAFRYPHRHPKKMAKDTKDDLGKPSDGCSSPPQRVCETPSENTNTLLQTETHTSAQNPSKKLEKSLKRLCFMAFEGGGGHRIVDMSTARSGRCM